MTTPTTLTLTRMDSVLKGGDPLTDDERKQIIAEMSDPDTLAPWHGFDELETAEDVPLLKAYFFTLCDYLKYSE